MATRFALSAMSRNNSLLRKPMISSPWLTEPETAIPLPTVPGAGLRPLLLDANHEPLLQRFFEANPDYFQLVHGEPVRADEARRELEDLPPDGWAYGARYLIGYQQAQGDLVAFASVITDLLAIGVWHIALFMVDTRQHGSGLAAGLHLALQTWAQQQGARWLRLGVVLGNTRAEHFWTRQGYVEVRQREGLPMGRLIQTVKVCLKPLDHNTVAQYLALVPRDRPDPTSSALIPSKR